MGTPDTPTTPSGLAFGPGYRPCPVDDFGPFCLTGDSASRRTRLGNFLTLGCMFGARVRGRNRHVAVGPDRHRSVAVFLFLYFLFLFFTKIYFQFGNLQKYTPGQPEPGRPADGRQGLIRKKKCRQDPEAGRPAVGRRPPLAARLLGDRLSHPI